MQGGSAQNVSDLDFKFGFDVDSGLDDKSDKAEGPWAMTQYLIILIYCSEYDMSK